MGGRVAYTFFSQQKACSMARIFAAKVRTGETTLDDVGGSGGGKPFLASGGLMAE
jgi:hypothetical protein